MGQPIDAAPLTTGGNGLSMGATSTFPTLSETTLMPTPLHLLLTPQMATRSQRQWTPPHSPTPPIQRPKQSTQLRSQTPPTRRPRQLALPHSPMARTPNQRLRLRLTQGRTQKTQQISLGRLRHLAPSTKCTVLVPDTR